MIRLRSVHQATVEIQSADPDTAMTEHLLKKLIQDGEISYRVYGTRNYLNMEILIQNLADLFHTEATEIPTMRTIRTAVKEIRQKDEYSAITEYKIRLWIKNGLLHSYAAGSKQIIAMEGFDKLLSDSDVSIPRNRNRTQSRKLSEQYEHLLASTTQSYVCKRKR